MNKSEGMPQQRPAWDIPPEGDPRLAARSRLRTPGGLGISPALMRQMAPGTVAPAVMPGGMTVAPGGGGEARTPIWQTLNGARPKQKTAGAPMAPVNNPFAGGGY